MYKNDEKCPWDADERYFAKILTYSDGTCDVIASNRRVFKPATDKMSVKTDNKRTERSDEAGEDMPPREENIERARRRARANVRRLALANDFKYFVTLTIDPSKIDSFDADATVKRLSQWLSNRVKRDGLKYVLVPELHKSGRIHFHGFVNGAVEVVDSGHRDSGGHVIYNLPAWIYGYTTAIELYGDRRSAVGYVCKYIGKDSTKIGGRWYYSGGALAKPAESYCDLPYGDLMEMQDEEFTAEYGQGWQKVTPAGIFAGVNGIRKDEIYGNLGKST